VGIFPDFLLIMVFYLGLHSKSPAHAKSKEGIEGVILSFLLGLIADIFSSGVIGATSFGLVFIFILTHLLSGKMTFDVLPVKTGGVFIMTLLKANLVYVVLRMLLFDRNIPFYIYAVPSAIITTVVSPLVFNLLDRIEQWEAGSRRI
ncbi:MAG: rod shape-determining protein MreD, partial [Deltaproteobacteria bacterium]|nr:rod shape-determining protein MreD [Deltaproteobacteria bacterium]